MFVGICGHFQLTTTNLTQYDDHFRPVNITHFILCLFMCFTSLRCGPTRSSALKLKLTVADLSTFAICGRSIDVCRSE